MYTFLSQEPSLSHSDHELISMNELMTELKQRGISVSRANELEAKLSSYAREGMIPPGKSQYSSKDRGIVDHYPRWVLNFLEKVDTLEKRGMSKDRIISSLLHHEIDEPPDVRLAKIRRNEGSVSGNKMLSQTRGLVRSGIKIGN